MIGYLINGFKTQLRMFALFFCKIWTNTLNFFIYIYYEIHK